MFDDLDSSLAAVLADAAAPAELHAAEVAFTVPDKDFTPAQSTVNLFLHEVQENRSLRDDEPWLQHLPGGGWTSTRAPMRVDCTYLVTAWSPKTGGLRAAEEHRLLGQALLWLSRFAIIPDSCLRGGLAVPAQPFPPPTLVAQTREGQSMGEFWTALGIAPRPAFSLTVTIALQPFPDAETFGDVSAIGVRSTLLSDPVLQGRIVDPALAAVAGATVQLVEAGRSFTAEQDGGFRFEAVPFGSYTLIVQAAGHPDATRQVDYEPDAQIHDVILTGP